MAHGHVHRCTQLMYVLTPACLMLIDNTHTTGYECVYLCTYMLMSVWNGIDLLGLKGFTEGDILMYLYASNKVYFS